MKYTRKEIDKELDYRKLQKIGRAFEADGHDVKLNAKRNVLRAILLRIYDANYAKADEEKALGVVDDVLAEPPKPEPIPEPVVESKPVVEPSKSDVKLYIAPRAYKDWASKWSFTPGMDKPKPLPGTLTPGLENAIKNKKIIPYEG